MHAWIHCTLFPVLSSQTTKGSWEEAYVLLAVELWGKKPAINNISRRCSIFLQISDDLSLRRGWGSLLEENPDSWVVWTQTRVDYECGGGKLIVCEPLLIFCATVLGEHITAGNTSTWCVWFDFVQERYWRVPTGDEVFYLHIWILACNGWAWP